jgi:uncharacterized membrane protein
MDATSGGRSRGLKLLLGLSLALNLAIAGAVGGMVLNRDRPEHRGPRLFDMGLFGMVAMLPPEERDALRQSYRAEMPYRDMDDSAEYLARLQAVLRAEPFDAAAFAEELAQRRRERDQVAERAEALLVGQVSGLGMEERARYADRLGRFRGHPPPPAHDRPHGRDR